MKLCFLLILSLFAYENIDEAFKSEKKHSVEHLMKKVRERIRPFKWDATFFHDKGWLIGGYSVNGMPLLYWTCGDPKSENRSLVLSAVHGDEVTPVYYGFRLVEWVKARPKVCEDKFIVVAPLVNPDGFLRYSNGTRTNYNKVDLNRNFSTPEWAENAHQLWRERYSQRRRYYPGKQADSQPETFFQKWLIQEFKVHKILSVHAPLNILDYDGPRSVAGDELLKAYSESCYDLKKQVVKATPSLKFYAYGTFPGSLGNYAGKYLGIPTLTTELPSTNASNAPKYFADMEKGNQVFFDFLIKDKPRYLKERGQKRIQASQESDKGKDAL
tara:strand:- start:75 stop:1058 length:984 start_codon:yes stop_codon:yes gene_type:complete